MAGTVRIRELWYVNNKKLLNRAIAAATWIPNMGTEPVSHCSEWEPDAGGHFGGGLSGSGEYVPYFGNCWTSTTRKAKGDPSDKAGTKVRPAAGVLDHPENWLYTEHEVHKPYFECAKSQAQRRVQYNKGYSFRDLGRYIMPLWLLKATGVADNMREICSEHVETWNVDMCVLNEKLIRSPRRLCKAIVLTTGSPLRRLCDDVIVRDGNWKKVNGIFAK